MPFRNAIARIAIADARRVEEQALTTLREVLAECPDSSTAAMIRDLIAEEESHLAHLDEALKGAPPCAARPPDAAAQVPPVPPSLRVEGALCDRLRQLLKMEESSILFYSILSERGLFGAVRDVFRHITEEERNHAQRLKEHIRKICGE